LVSNIAGRFWRRLWDEMITRCIFFMILVYFIRIDAVNIAKPLQSSKFVHSLRNEVIQGFDTNLHDILGAVKGILEKNTGETIEYMHELHLLPKMSHISTDNAGELCSSQQLLWNVERGRLKQDCVDKYETFDKAYRKFIEEYIGPRMGGGRIIYQRAPTLRIFFPTVTHDNLRTTALHNDKDYHHQPSEINLWLPLCKVYGNNSLWLESEPDKGDWHSLEMDYGQVCRFYGNLCRHFTKPNDTGKTRASIDFRVVSDFSGPHDPRFDRGVPRGSKAKYQKFNDVGGYYSEMILPETPHLIEADIIR
jgi:hypothetical protein